MYEISLDNRQEGRAIKRGTQMNEDVARLRAWLSARSPGTIKYDEQLARLLWDASLTG